MHKKEFTLKRSCQVAFYYTNSVTATLQQQDQTSCFLLSNRGTNYTHICGLLFASILP